MPPERAGRIAPPVRLRSPHENSTMHTSSKLAAMALLFGVLGVTPALAKDTVIHAGRLIDGVSRTVRANVSILLTDDRIVSVTPGYTDPPGAEVIDLSRETVLPGLIDCHVHLLIQVSSNPQLDQETRPRFTRRELQELATLRSWRVQFAENLRELGVAANATERAVRGLSRT